MIRVTLADYDLLKFGNTITLAGAVFSGEGVDLLLPLPGCEINQVTRLMEMTPENWHRILDQTDVQNVEMATKAIVRKSQRIIDGHMQWAVWRRDKFACRYCGVQDRPLTVDHVDLWEDGGATHTDNLTSACRPCNKARGSMPFEQWLASEQYATRSKGLSAAARSLNASLAGRLDYLRSLRPTNQRSR